MSLFFATSGEGVTTSEALHDAGIIYAAEPDYVSIDSWIERWLERTSGAPNLAVMQRTMPCFHTEELGASARY